MGNFQDTERSSIQMETTILASSSLGFDLAKEECSMQN